ncbi:hypothetical protein FNYG_11234 [Fusarium nygamai]|uniref:Uncharacterized protein n=1 Tax=Gibberella nygamai TaxID=42673 RepID=A0A2K0VZH2_GIBNY|nr:hypothetical protein FNYG_11234 [Fusarium nygamai]
MQLGEPECSTCCISFKSFEEHREHSKSEEHDFKIQIRYSAPSIPRYVIEKAMENWDRVSRNHGMKPWKNVQEMGQISVRLRLRTSMKNSVSFAAIRARPSTRTWLT